MRIDRSSFVAVVLGAALMGTGAAAEEPTGTKVVVRLPESNGQMPEAEKLVKSLEAVGPGTREARVLRRNEQGKTEIILELWGHFAPAAEIPRTLRDAFPVLAGATIDVSALAAADRPKLDPNEAPEGSKGKRVIVKKIVKRE